MGKHDEILVATETFSCEVDDESYVVHAGKTRVRADHPLVKANPDRFKPVELDVSYDVEQATAAPGEKRGQRGASSLPPDPEPFEGYDQLNVKEVGERLQEASADEIATVKAYEADHQNRKTVLEFEPKPAEPSDGQGQEPGGETPES